MNLLIDKKYNLFVLATIVFVGILTYPSTRYLVQEWAKWDQALSQGFACLGFVIFFVWRLIFIDDPQSKTGSRLWILLLFGSSCGWCLAQLGNLQLAAYLASLIILIFYLASCINFQAFKKLLPICGLFLFAVPIWSGQFLVELSSLVVGFMLQLSDLTLHIQDNQILTPWGTIVIADGCSGLRYLIIALLLSYLLCLLNRYSIKTGALVFAIAILLGLMTNWIRITLIVLIGYHTEMTHSLVRDHELFGWILFAVIIFPAIYLAPQKKISHIPIPVKFRFNLLILSALLTGPLIYFFIPFHPANNNPIDFRFKKDYPESFSRPELFLQYPANDQVNNKVIAINNIPMHIEIMLLTAKHKEDKVVPYIGAIYDQIKWRNISTKKISGSTIETLEQRDSKQRLLLAYRYQIGPWKTSNYIKAKFLQIPAKLTNQAYFGLWSAQVVCESNCENEMVAFKELSENW